MATTASQNTITDERGGFRLANVQPGVYTLKVELPGFKTAQVERVTLQVDSVTRETVTLEVGGVAETVSVVSETTHLNTTDASVGNVMSREQIRSLPVEAQNVVHLLSLQPGAIFIPTSNPATVDPRYGSVAGARADQQSVTLDGIDVNDPQMATAYTSAIRMTQEALQEFRVSTSNYNAEMGRSSGPQVSLVTRSGTNQFDGSGYWTFRRTATSTNEYFLELSQKAAGQESKAPKLDKDIFGGSFGGPIQRNRLFFFANLEQLKEASEAPVVRNVPSNSMRDGVLIYQCATAGACPGGSVRGVANNHSVPCRLVRHDAGGNRRDRSAGYRPKRRGTGVFPEYPSPNDPGRDNRNLMDYRFAAPIENDFFNIVSRVDYKAADNHSFFARIGKQDDTINTAPQFEGLDPLRQRLFNNWGGAIGYDAVLSPTLTNSFRYGFTKIDENNAGLTNSNYNTFRFISPYEGIGSSFTDTRATPTQNFVNDLSWFKGRHTMKAGTNIRFTRVPKEPLPEFVPQRHRQSVVGGGHRPAQHAGQRVLHRSWLQPPGGGHGLPGRLRRRVAEHASASCHRPRSAPTTTRTARRRRPAARWRAKSRRISTEWYVQDAWQLRPNLTLTAGVRYSLYSPPYETNGMQVAPTVSMGQWFDQRMANMKAGIPSSASEIVTFNLAGPKNNKPGFYAWDKNNFAPRIALAWTPAERLVVRGGYSKVFDRVGVGLATNFDEGFAFGMSTQISSPFGAAYETNPGARFVNITTMPPTMPAAPAGGFPQTPPQRAGIITSSIDDTLVTPSAHMASAIVGYDLTRNYSVEVGYVGRFGRDMLIRRDIAMPLNLTDPGSGMDYFTAAQQMIRAAQAAGLNANSPATAYAGLPRMAYWENLVPGAAGGGLTATQAMTRAFMQNGPDWITALYDMDTACSPACTKFGPYAFFAEQYDSLAAISSIGRANYNGMNVSLRRRFADGIQFDINYTLAKSEDMGSQVERGSSFGNFSNGGSTGFLINSFEPELNYGTSDFDVRHQVNTNWLAELPFGQGKRFGGGVGNAMNAFIGDWSIAGLLRWTSGFPFSVANCRSCWATNWNLQGNAMLVDRGPVAGNQDRGECG